MCSLSEAELGDYFNGLFVVIFVVAVLIYILHSRIRTMVFLKKILIVLCCVMISTLGYTLFFVSFYLGPFFFERIDNWERQLNQNNSFVYMTTKRAYHEVRNMEDLSEFPVLFNNVIIPVTSEKTIRTVGNSMSHSIVDNFFKSIPLAVPLLELNQNSFADATESMMLNHFPLIRKQVDSIDRIYDYQVSCFPDLENVLIRRNARTGSIQISLFWFTKDDLDVHLQNPRNDWIFFAKKFSNNKAERADDPKIPNLDIDANVQHNLNNPVENIFINKSLAGKYSVFVDGYSLAMVKYSNGLVCNACGSGVANASSNMNLCGVCGIQWGNSNSIWHKVPLNNSQIPYVLRVKRFNNVHYYRGSLNRNSFDRNRVTKEHVVSWTNSGMQNRDIQSFDAKIAINHIRKLAERDARDKVISVCTNFFVIGLVVLLLGWVLGVINYSIAKSKFELENMNYR